MTRRQVVSGLASAIALWPLRARAQQPGGPVVGFLSSRSPDESAAVVAAFRKGLAETGFVEDRNVAIAFRWAEGQYARLPVLADELVSAKVAVILAAGGAPAALAAKEATASIPVVFSGAPDPVGFGLVASLNHPGGNVTGMATLTIELGAKSIEIVRDMLPRAATIAYLVNPTNRSKDVEAEGARATAHAHDIRLLLLQASTESELDDVFATLAPRGVEALVVAADPFFDTRRERLVALAARHAIPTKYGWRENVLAGGLMSYGTSLPDSYRRAGLYVGRILKGEKPGDLPVMQPARFELVLNLRTARAIGLVFPPALLARADEVIE